MKTQDLLGPTISRYGMEYLGRFYATYRAITVDNKDPENKCRLILKVPALFSDQSLPNWAVPKNHRGTVNAGNKPLLPNAGEVVWVSFINGDWRYPLWEFHGWAEGEMPEELKGDDVAGTITPHGNKYIIDDKNSNVDITIVNPTDKSKSVNVKITGGKDVSVTTSEGNVDILAKAISLHNNPSYAQPALLGDSTVEVFKQLLTTLIEGKVVTKDGLAPFGPDTIARFNHIKSELNKILADIVKVE